jgi:hypothetical protein
MFQAQIGRSLGSLQLIKRAHMNASHPSPFPVSLEFPYADPLRPQGSRSNTFGDSTYIYVNGGAISSAWGKKNVSCHDALI